MSVWRGLRTVALLLALGVFWTFGAAPALAAHCRAGLAADASHAALCVCRLCGQGRKCCCITPTKRAATTLSSLPGTDTDCQIEASSCDLADAESLLIAPIAARTVSAHPSLATPPACFLHAPCFAATQPRPRSYTASPPETPPRFFSEPTG